MNIHRKGLKEDDSDCRLTDSAGKDLGRVNEDGFIVYPEDTGMELIKGVKALGSARKHIAGLEKELREYRMRPAQLVPLNLKPLTDQTDPVTTHVHFDSGALRNALTVDGREQPWLSLGSSTIERFGRGGAVLKVRMRDGITDFEHSSCYIVWIELVGLEWEATYNGETQFRAYITSDLSNIKISDPDFKPEEVEGARRCDRCEDRHWILPDGYMTPGTPDFCRLVAGKRITITTTPIDTSNAKIDQALKVALECGQCDGGHHKMWVIDQMVRALVGDRYEQIVADYKMDPTQEWYEGIAP